MEKVYNALIDTIKEDLNNNEKFVLFPLGEIMLVKKEGKWFNNKTKVVTEGKKYYFKFIPFKNYYKEVKKDGLGKEQAERD